MEGGAGLFRGVFSFPLVPRFGFPEGFLGGVVNTKADFIYDGGVGDEGGVLGLGWVNCLEVGRLAHGSQSAIVAVSRGGGRAVFFPRYHGDVGPIPVQTRPKEWVVPSMVKGVTGRGSLGQGPVRTISRWIASVPGGGRNHDSIPQGGLQAGEIRVWHVRGLDQEEKEGLGVGLGW